MDEKEILSVVGNAAADADDDVDAERKHPDRDPYRKSVDRPHFPHHRPSFPRLYAPLAMNVI